MKTALIITTYNRPEYLRECLHSLKRLTEPPELLLLIDDASNDKFTIAQIESLRLPKVDISRSFGETTRGIKAQLKTAYYYVFGLGYDLAINLDADAIVSPDFITRLKDLKARYPDHIVSGFNCNNPKNPIIYDGPDYVLRKHVNGINMCIDKRQYESIVLPALQSEGNWDYNSTHQLSIVISKPSVVQHIAPNDSTMGHVGGDVACDFPTL